MKIQIDSQTHDSTAQWYSYAYLGVDSHEYMPCQYSATDGVNGAACVTADDSLWTVDTPESPRSILALILPTVLEAKLPPLDLKNISVSFYLRGDDLQLFGAQCYFWIVTFSPYTTRWHYTHYPLEVPEGRWSAQQTLVLNPDESLWHCSFSAETPRVPVQEALTCCHSFGFSFVGFSEKVLGKLSLSEFVIHKNLDTQLTYFANFHRFRHWLTLDRNQGCQVSAPVDVDGRVILLNDENYAVFKSQEISYSYLAFVGREYSTRQIPIEGRIFYFMLGWQEVTPKPLISYMGGSMHFFLGNSTTSTIWIMRQPIDEKITLGRLSLHEDEATWFRLSGNVPLSMVFAGAAHQYGYDYLGLMLVGVKRTPVGHWALAEFAIL